MKYDSIVKRSIYLLQILAVIALLFCASSVAFAADEELDNSDGYYNEVTDSNGEAFIDYEADTEYDSYLTYEERADLIVEDMNTAFDGVFETMEEETLPVEDPVYMNIHCKNNVRVISYDQEKESNLILCYNNRDAQQIVTKGDDFLAYVVCDSSRYSPILKKTGDYKDVELIRVDGTNQWLLIVKNVTGDKDITFTTKQLNPPVDDLKIMESMEEAVPNSTNNPME